MRRMAVSIRLPGCHHREMGRARRRETADHPTSEAPRRRHAGTVEIDAAYAAYETQPLDQPDEWGDLASFHAAATTA